MTPEQISKIISQDIRTNNGLILEIGIKAAAGKLLKGGRGFGPGVAPTQFGEPGEKIEAGGDPYVKFEQEWEKAEQLEQQGKNNNDAQSLITALEIYKRLADINPISGLKSKSYFKRHTAGSKLYVVIDLDNLKYANTKLGHSGADTVLRTFGELLSKYFEPIKHSKVYHKSGDEFSVLINREGLNKQQLIDLVKDVEKRCNQVLRQFAKRPFQNELGGIRVTATFGIGLNELNTDKMVEVKKNERKKIRPFGEEGHVFVNPDIEKYLRQP